MVLAGLLKGKVVKVIGIWGGRRCCLVQRKLMSRFFKIIGPSVELNVKARNCPGRVLLVPPSFVALSLSLWLGLSCHHFKGKLPKVTFSCLFHRCVFLWQMAAGIGSFQKVFLVCHKIPPFLVFKKFPFEKELNWRSSGQTQLKYFKRCWVLGTENHISSSLSS